MTLGDIAMCILILIDTITGIDTIPWLVQWLMMTNNLEIAIVEPKVDLTAKIHPFVDVAATVVRKKTNKSKTAYGERDLAVKNLMVPNQM